MRQVGPRDETKMRGGIGPCGLTLCCSTFLKSFHPVTIKMAKNQNLSLNPSKISGMCGRLMCCLAYEDEGAGPGLGAPEEDPEYSGGPAGLSCQDVPNLYRGEERQPWPTETLPAAPSVATTRPPANRKLIRPNLAELADRYPTRSFAQRKQVPPEQTNAESYYYLKQMAAKTPMVVVLTDGEKIQRLDRVVRQGLPEGEPRERARTC